ncbi:putative Rad51 family DNA repair protein [Aspergillus uvarum CBS 121591]|uniref:Putative Rad51 family DNA repair protein n=1 Tax=Aspergillus uvarum CBS 121591 TaxID=1448315 RepID=A0A319CC61_9EURO|nr:putative Rad51 family DNA repair protein [Aspergillus uvarum CBS 121591]PYH76193.1 putative Rad51 family DNA repair protein [Aspergillus uvarum CBS 121591]
MAAAFGERLLTEVHEERLDELLHDFRGLYQERIGRNTLKPSFGVDELDNLLGIFTAPAPSGQHRADTAQEELQITSEHDPEGELAHNQSGIDANTHSAGITVPAYTSHADPVLEISSTSSAAGKTNLLYYLTALAVLPAEVKGFQIGGHDSAVVFIDTDGRFDAERLRTVLRGIVKVKCGAQDMSRLDEETERTIESCLEHVHIFQPQSSSALLATLQQLDTYLLDLARHVSSSRALRLLFLDSANAFYWQDRLQDEVTRIEQIGRPAAEIETDRRKKQSFYLFAMYTDLVRELKRLQRVFSCAIVFTTTAAPHTIPSRHSPGYQPSGPYELFDPLDAPAFRRPSFRSALPAPWGTFPALRVVVQRDPVRPFPAAMGLQEAEENAAKRQEVLRRGQFCGWVNMWGREDWPRRWLEGVEALDGGMFFFRMGRDGVQFG